MRSPTRMLIVAAIVIAFATVVIASTLSSSRAQTHAMPDGSSMQDGTMP